VTTVKILWHAPHRRPTEDVGEGHAGGRAYHTVAYDVEIWKIE